MPPKKPQPIRNESKPKGDAVEGPLLQAVVLADSYNRRFEVLCLDQPRVLLPLCSTPLLSWTLESLALSKVKQVFIFCGVHADKIRDFVASSPYNSTLDIQCLSSKTARTAGDALRELDAMHVLDPEKPFILVQSPIISNYDLSKIVDAHKKRREVDKNFIMTMGIGRGGRRHPESPIMLVHPASSRLLHYVQQPLSPAPLRVTFPASIFLDPFPVDMDSYEVWSGPSASSSRGGFRDLGIDICEADIPALCTENFDYHDLRRHLVNGVLTSELLGKKIAVHLVGSEDDEEVKGDHRSGSGGKYVERVRDTRTFAEITRDMLRRWAFPLAPDLNDPSGVQYELRKGNVYIARDNVVLSRTTTLRGPLLIGPRSALNHNTLVNQSTLGADCSVGPNTTITTSYIFDDVRIGANCLLEECIVGKNVQIADGVKIGRGVLIGDGVKLGKGAAVPDFARIGRERYRPDNFDSDDEDEDEDDEVDDPRRLQVLGPDSVGFIWPQEEEEPPSDSEDEGEDPFEHPRNKRLLQLGRTLSNLTASSASLSTLSKASSSPPESPMSGASDDSLPDMPSLILDSGPPAAFYSEASASIARAYEEGHSTENAALEMKTLVMGYNAGIDRAREEIMKFLLGKVDASGKLGDVLTSATKVFSRWGGMVKEFSPSDPTNIALDAQLFSRA
ncbi:nucleotide-diphospho-sugar transferase [Naematelia encephala]|uniref:Nucleotide-diphospho-sugar transferase n=1 Tax=Naematelia encephala TaxID=71784 RepID=A0A1Y2AL92_9TREE|nr:nucleotide-diphospho-sugar transferase [Naematelia encephala]